MYEFLGDYPSDREAGWTEDIQGVTHDNDYWFFTQIPVLWKFPVWMDLNEYINAANPARGILKTDIPIALSSSGYKHFGDLDHYNGHLFVPMEGTSPPVIAVFRAADLHFVGSFPLIHPCGDHSMRPQVHAAWCAINPKNGELITSDGKIARGGHDFCLFCFRIDHNALAAGRVTARCVSFKHLIVPFTLEQMQGGAFSEDGSLLFLTHGLYKDCDEKKCGIKVFDWGHSGLVASSVNGSGSFNFEFHQGDYQEPEGITIWDLDNGRAPHIGGQVHAIMLENDRFSADDLYFKHYRRVGGSPVVVR
jgi:hypothetical protein